MREKKYEWLEAVESNQWRTQALVYVLLSFQQKVMSGVWKDLPGKIHHKFSENWVSATLIIGPLVGVCAYVQNYWEK
jgi:hypothetical protein